MKIVQVVAEVLRLPTVEAKSSSCQDTLLLRIRTDDGLEGIGEVESSPEPAKAVIDAGFSHTSASGVRDLLIGRDPLETQRLADDLFAATRFMGRKGLVATVLAGVDIALWDLKGKALGLPVHTLLGGAHQTRVRGYASSLFGDTPGQTAEIAARWTSYGYTAVKFGWGPFGGDAHTDERHVAAARDAIGPGTDLFVDAGQVFDARTALDRAHLLAGYGAGWLEEPLAPDDLEGYAWLRGRSPIAIASGESEASRAEFEPWIERRALDVYQVDLARTGFTDGAHVLRRIEDAGARAVNHWYKTPVSGAACLHWIATARRPYVFEDCVDDSPLRTELVNEKVQSGPDGWIAVPDGPGLGITLNEDCVARYRVTSSGT